jgi:hypothetical protein
MLKEISPGLVQDSYQEILLDLLTNPLLSSRSESLIQELERVKLNVEKGDLIEEEEDNEETLRFQVIPDESELTNKLGKTVNIRSMDEVYAMIARCYHKLSNYLEIKGLPSTGFRSSFSTDLKSLLLSNYQLLPLKKKIVYDKGQVPIVDYFNNSLPLNALQELVVLLSNEEYNSWPLVLDLGEEELLEIVFNIMPRMGSFENEADFSPSKMSSVCQTCQSKKVYNKCNFCNESFCMECLNRIKQPARFITFFKWRDRICIQIWLLEICIIIFFFQ